MGASGPDGQPFPCGCRSCPLARVGGEDLLDLKRKNSPLIGRLPTNGALMRSAGRRL